jgi:hypothetical protein
MQINLSEDRANKIKTSKSIRISLLEEERIAQMGMSVTEALRKGLDMVLNGGSGVPDAEAAPAVVKKSEWEPLEEPMWLKHVDYLTTSESLLELQKNWDDFKDDIKEAAEYDSRVDVNAAVYHRFYQAEISKLVKAKAKLST